MQMSNNFNSLTSKLNIQTKLSKMADICWHVKCSTRIQTIGMIWQSANKINIIPVKLSCYLMSKTSLAI